MPYANIAKQYIFLGSLFPLPASEQRLGDWRMHNEIIYIWLVVEPPTPLRNDGVKVSWDDDIPNWMESHRIPWFQTTNQIYITMENHHF